MAARNNNFEALNLMLDNYFLTNESEMAESTLRNSFKCIQKSKDVTDRMVEDLGRKKRFLCLPKK